MGRLAGLADALGNSSVWAALLDAKRQDVQALARKRISCFFSFTPGFSRVIDRRRHGETV